MSLLGCRLIVGVPLYIIRVLPGATERIAGRGAAGTHLEEPNGDSASLAGGAVDKACMYGRLAVAE